MNTTDLNIIDSGGVGEWCRKNGDNWTWTTILKKLKKLLIQNTCVNSCMYISFYISSEFWIQQAAFSVMLKDNLWKDSGKKRWLKSQCKYVPFVYKYMYRFFLGCYLVLLLELCFLHFGVPGSVHSSLPPTSAPQVPM